MKKLNQVSASLDPALKYKACLRRLTNQMLQCVKSTRPSKQAQDATKYKIENISQVLANTKYKIENMIQVLANRKYKIENMSQVLANTKHV